MFKEPKAIEYAIEIVMACSASSMERYGSKDIFKMLEDRQVIQSPSFTYLQKILSRLVKAGIFTTNESGYKISRSPDEISMKTIMSIVDIPSQGELLYPLCNEITGAMSLTMLSDLYNYE